MKVRRHWHRHERQWLFVLLCLALSCRVLPGLFLSCPILFVSLGEEASNTFYSSRSLPTSPWTFRNQQPSTEWCLSCLASSCLVLSCHVLSCLVLSDLILFVSLGEEASNKCYSSDLYLLARGRFEISSRRQTGAWISLSQSVRWIDYMSSYDIVFFSLQVSGTNQDRPQWSWMKIKVTNPVFSSPFSKVLNGFSTLFACKKYLCKMP